MTSKVPLFEQDYIRYKAGIEWVTGEILELDIPHPKNPGDTQTYIRVQTPVGIKLTTRAEVDIVLCPQCNPLGKPLPTREYGVAFRALVLKSGEVTIPRGEKELRHFRYCEICQYFKEAK